MKVEYYYFILSNSGIGFRLNWKKETYWPYTVYNTSALYQFFLRTLYCKFVRPAHYSWTHKLHSWYTCFLKANTVLMLIHFINWEFNQKQIWVSLGNHSKYVWCFFCMWNLNWFLLPKSTVLYSWIAYIFERIVMHVVEDYFSM